MLSYNAAPATLQLVTMSKLQPGAADVIEDTLVVNGYHMCSPFCSSDGFGSGPIEYGTTSTPDEICNDKGKIRRIHGSFDNRCLLLTSLDLTALNTSYRKSFSTF